MTTTSKSATTNYGYSFLVLRQSLAALNRDSKDLNEEFAIALGYDKKTDYVSSEIMKLTAARLLTESSVTGAVSIIVAYGSLNKPL